MMVNPTQKCMVLWLRNAIQETRVPCEVSHENNFLTGDVEVTYYFKGYTLTFTNWDLETMYQRLIENKNLSEIECARLTLKQKLKDLIKSLDK